MPKTCSHTDCTFPVFGKGYCKRHQYMRKDKKEVKRCRPVKIKKVSDKMKPELALYAKLSRKYKQENPHCMAKLECCTGQTSDVHHKAKRGKNLNNVETWMAVCRPCHSAIHNSMSSQEARDKGLIL